MVLATVYETIGSTYSKAGHRILIAANGDYQGLVSGGCLEGDLAGRAQAVSQQHRAAAVTYDLRDEGDDLFGLGVGCNGLIRILLQPLVAAEGFEPFASIARAMLARDTAGAATIVERGASEAHAGATLIRADGTTANWGIGPDLEQRLSSGCDAAIRTGRARYELDDRGVGILYAPLRPIPRLLVLGAGLDAIPVVNLAWELGWIVTVADHRPAYIERGGFERAEHAFQITAADLDRTVALEEFDAIIVMSHHLETDKIYLRQLASGDTRYLGVLGPPVRKERLLEELGELGQRLRDRLRGPVGIDIGADSPESIALSIMAEMQAVIADRNRRT